MMFKLPVNYLSNQFQFKWKLHSRLRIFISILTSYTILSCSHKSPETNNYQKPVDFKENSRVGQSITKYDNGKIEITCEDYGVDALHARKHAVESCKKSLSLYLDGSISVDQFSYTSINTKQVGSYIRKGVVYENIPCEPVFETIKKESKETIAIVTCLFDLTAAINKSSNTSKQGQISNSERRIKLIISPMCEKITIISNREPRSIVCQSAVNFLYLTDDDLKIIIEKEHYLPLVFTAGELNNSNTIYLQKID